MKLFIAAPFTEYFTDKDKNKTKGKVLKSLIEGIYKQLETTGYQIDCCHVREKWGHQILPPDECTVQDYQTIKKADIIIAIPGNPISGGVHIELGWASILGKRIILLLENNGQYTPLIHGLSRITSVETVYYNNQKEALSNLSTIIRKGTDDVYRKSLVD